MDIISSFLIVGLFVLLSQYVAGPIFVFNSQRFPQKFRFQKFDPREFLAGQSETFRHLHNQLENLGFEYAGSSQLVNPGSILLFSLYNCPDLKLSCSLSTAHSKPMNTTQIEFAQMYADGSVLCVNNFPLREIFPHNEKKRIYRFPEMNDVVELLKATKALLERHDIGQARVALERGDEFSTLEAFLDEELQFLIDKGWVSAVAKDGEHGLRPKGAVLMTWQLCWPLKQFLAQRQESFSRRVLNSTGYSSMARPGSGEARITSTGAENAMNSTGKGEASGRRATIHKIVHVCAALLIASMAPALVIGGAAFSSQLMYVTFLIAVGHAAVIGLPVLALLWWKRRVNQLSAMLAGFFVGAVGVAIWAWPLRFGSLKSNAWTGSEQVQTMVDGIPTAAGWLEYLFGVGVFGAFGALGGFVFWAWFSRSWGMTAGGVEIRSEKARRARRSLLMPAGAVVAAVLVFSVPAITKDRSCHNVFRDGRSSARPEVNIDLDVPIHEWQELARVFQEFSNDAALSFRSDVDTNSETVKTLYLSLCSESGFLLSASAQRWASNDFEPQLHDRGVGIGVFETIASSDWQALTSRLIEKFEDRWPDRLRFRDGGGNLIETPRSLQHEQTEHADRVTEPD